MGGLFLITWIFSGWLSVDPFRFFASPGIGQAGRISYAGKALPPVLALDRLAIVAKDAKRIEFHWIAGQTLIDIPEGSKEQVMYARTLMPARLDPALIARAAVTLIPSAKIIAVDRLTVPDSYWYEVGALPKLPVLRVRYDDPAATWVHIDPRTSAILGDTDARRRLYRWAFDLPHKWDFNGLTLNRPAWDILLWFFSLLGLATSITGVRISWIRLRHRAIAQNRG